MNAGAIELDGRILVVVRVEGADRKSFFAVAESVTGTEGFKFWNEPVQLPDADPAETNLYDMRLTRHESGLCWALADSMENCEIGEETTLDRQAYHTIKEGKVGAGAPPIRTPEGWLHIAHAVRGCASGMRSSNATRACAAPIPCSTPPSAAEQSSPRWKL
jgi:predicted GH43/DUF377 family glycosyl hydrolase